MKNYYICECGKEFDNPQKFNGHKSHCPVHLGEEKAYKRNHEHMLNMNKKSKEALAEARKQLENQKLQEWISEQHVCETCGKIMISKYGSGRFCCKKCANHRIISEEERQRKRESVLRTLQNKKDVQEHILKNNYISGYYNGIYCSSGYELIYLLYCQEHNIEVERCKITFAYNYKNKNKIYVPDFYLPDLGRVIELKGKGPHYDKDMVDAKSAAARASGYDFKIIYDDEFEEIYYKWARDFYNFSIKDYRKFCESMYNGEILQHEDRTHSPRTKGYKWMNDGEKHTLVPANEIFKYLEKGWSFGRLKTQGMLDSWIKVRTFRKLAEEKNTKIFSSAYRKGKKQIYKDDRRIFVLPEELPQYLADGWRLGTGHKQTSSRHSGGNHKRNH